ncbi:MAG: DUF3108 domain-containing protein [Duncaniella sp.]|nr:DUF3108 domain-containing protein [Duncaniella sp.]MDE5751247.1 DUF3108 domain-containing protein [Duncaniella sp.]MDE6572625.1 DUF3108 domain-containing protein [Duncaniella sp.]MDE6766415.1 DUF3108 domain-containing protein [Duncaniella sp.]
MKRLFIIPLIAISLLSVPGPRAGAQELMQSHHNPAVSLVDETLTYDIIYKWGFINKVAGYATLSLRNDGNLYRATLYGRNAPWANRIYMLRDTLYSTMTKQGLYPVKYVYIAHEEGKYKKDIVDFTRSGNEFSAECIRYKRPKNGAETTSSTIRLEASGMTVDMLSSFFYLRTLDFDNINVGESVTLNIFSGSKKEKLRITYRGKSSVELNGENVASYKINFTFTRKGKQSSAPITGWISADDRRIPLKVEGQLPVGKVRAIYTGPNP